MKKPGTELEILQWPHPMLNQIAKPVTDFNDKLDILCENMIYTMDEAKGIGLSANQIGVLKRIIVMKRVETGNNIVLINPGLLKAAGGIRIEEQCLSIPNIICSIERYNFCEVAYTNLNKETYCVTFKGLDAVCFQHELDHLNGMTIIDHRGE